MKELFTFLRCGSVSVQTQHYETYHQTDLLMSAKVLGLISETYAPPFSCRTISTAIQGTVYENRRTARQCQPTPQCL